MPPVILIFDPGGVTPSDDHDCEEVVALGDQLGEVELGRKSRIFSHSDEFSIAPHSGEALCPAEVHDDIARSPVARNGEGCSVEACRIVFRNIGRFLTRPGHYDVGVVGEVGTSDETSFGEPRWYVRLAGESKEIVTIWLTLGQRTLRYETYVMPAPEDNAAELADQLLRRNDRLVGAHFSIGHEDAIYLRGAIPVSAVTTDELDRVVGTLYQTVEHAFPALIRLGFARRFAD